MIQHNALEMRAPKRPSLPARLVTPPNSPKAGPCADNLPGTTNAHFLELQHCSQLISLPLCPVTTFTCPLAALVRFSITPGRVLSIVVLSVKACQGVMLTSRGEQEVYFPFHGKVLEFKYFFCSEMSL